MRRKIVLGERSKYIARHLQPLPKDVAYLRSESCSAIVRADRCRMMRHRFHCPLYGDGIGSFGSSRRSTLA